MLLVNQYPISLVLLVLSVDTSAILYYIDQIHQHKGIQLVALDNVTLQDSVIPVSNSSSFPYQVMLVAPIWDCHVVLISFDSSCPITGLLKMKDKGNFHLTILNTTTETEFVDAVAQPFDDGLYVCGWPRRHSKTMCEFLSRKTMMFRSVPTTMDIHRKGFIMHRRGQQICQLGGLKYEDGKVADSRTKSIECAIADPNGLNFTQDLTINLTDYRGGLPTSSLLINDYVLICGGLSKTNQASKRPGPFCESRALTVDSQIVFALHVPKALGLDHNTHSVLVKLDDSIALFYAYHHSTEIVVSKHLQSLFRRSLNRPLSNIKPFSIGIKCITSQKYVATDGKEATEHHSRTELINILIALLTVCSLVIMSLVGFVCKLWIERSHTRLLHDNAVNSNTGDITGSQFEQRLSRTGRSSSKNASVTQSVSILSESEGKCIKAPKSSTVLSSVDYFGSNSLKKQQANDQVPKDAISSEVDIGFDSSTIQTLTKIFQKAKLFKPSKARPHRETSKLETVSTNIPSGPRTEMNPRGEGTTSTSLVPIEEMPMDFLKRQLRKIRKKRKHLGKG